MVGLLFVPGHWTVVLILAWLGTGDVGARSLKTKGKKEGEKRKETKRKAISYDNNII